MYSNIVLFLNRFVNHYNDIRMSENRQNFSEEPIKSVCRIVFQYFDIQYCSESQGMEVMRGIYIGVIAMLFFGMVLFPLFSMKKTVLPTKPENPPIVTEPISGETFKVKLTEQGKIIELSAKDYIYGVVCAEMPAEYSEEALKAQAVAAYTFALYRKQENSGKEYDITDSTTPDQAYMTDEAFKKREGSNYEVYKAKIKAAVDTVFGQVITYEGQIVLPIFHDISGGKTESAEVLWGGSYPYLQPVESVGDLMNPDYLSEKAVTSDDFKSALKEYNITFSGEPEGWIGDIKRSESGTVLTAEICGVSLKGSELRTALSLRSANFDVSCSDGSFRFSVRGHGHGVGMSQYGAQFMALQGSGYKEILKWYYKGCEIG